MHFVDNNQTTLKINNASINYRRSKAIMKPEGLDLAR